MTGGISRVIVLLTTCTSPVEVDAASKARTLDLNLPFCEVWDGWLGWPDARGLARLSLY